MSKSVHPSIGGTHTQTYAHANGALRPHARTRSFDREEGGRPCEATAASQDDRMRAVFTEERATPLLLRGTTSDTPLGQPTLVSTQEARSASRPLTSHYTQEVRVDEAREEPARRVARVRQQNGSS